MDKVKLARDPNTSATVLVLLYELALVTRDSCILSCLASNISTPPKILDKLSLIDEYRYNLAMNPSTPDYILVQYYCNHDIILRRWVARNPNTPIHILKSLSKDSDRETRNSALKNLKPKQLELDLSFKSY
jgi:hypothetical protein